MVSVFDNGRRGELEDAGLEDRSERGLGLSVDLPVANEYGTP